MNLIKQNFKQYFLFLLFILLSSCAKDKCADGGCTGDTDVYDYNFGMSRLVAVSAEEGKLLWGADFQGEKINIVELRDDDSQLFVTVEDSCFIEKSKFAFDVKNGKEVNLAAKEEAVANPCADFENSETPSLTLVDGVCAGRVESIDSLTTLRGIDTADGSLLWENELLFDSFEIKDNIIVTIYYIEKTKEYRLSRISPVTGKSIWFYQQQDNMFFAGADSSRIFILDSDAFALESATGDVAWEMVNDGWSFKAPRFSDAKVLGGTLYAVRNMFPQSPCADTELTDSDTISLDSASDSDIDTGTESGTD